MDELDVGRELRGCAAQHSFYPLVLVTLLSRRTRISQLEHCGITLRRSGIRKTCRPGDDAVEVGRQDGVHFLLALHYIGEVRVPEVEPSADRLLQKDLEEFSVVFELLDLKFGGF